MFGPKYQLGLDIGNSSVKAVVIDKKNSDMLISKIGVAVIPEGTVAGGKVIRPDLLTKSIKEAVLEAGGKVKNVCFTVHHQNVIIRHLTLPPMEEAEIQEALKWELKNNIPFTGKAVYDFQVLEKNIENVNILLAAVEETIALDYCGCIKEAGLIPSAIDIQPLAFARLINMLAERGRLDTELQNNWEQDTVMLIDLSEHCTSLSFFTLRKLNFFRVISFGGSELSAILAQNLGVSAKNAEKLLSQYGLFENPYYGAEQIGELKSALHKFLQEIKRSIKFFQVQHPDYDVSGAVLAGEVSGLRGLEDVLGDELTITIKVLNPFPAFKAIPDIEPKVSEYGNTLSLGLGLAVREVGP